MTKAIKKIIGKKKKIETDLLTNEGFIISAKKKLMTYIPLKLMIETKNVFTIVYK